MVVPVVSSLAKLALGRQIVPGNRCPLKATGEATMRAVSTIPDGKFH
jgi:hypothetical protein